MFAFLGERADGQFGDGVDDKTRKADWQATCATQYVMIEPVHTYCTLHIPEMPHAAALDKLY